MNPSTPSSARPSSARSAPGRYLLPMALMVSLYFSIGFITALNDILVPHFKDLFHLSNKLALLVQFCFFAAYFVMSVPAGWVVGRIGYKAGIIAALSVMGCGLLLFVPASIVISYPFFLFALFVVGSGLALLQVAINPYVGALGPPETAASRLNLCGGLNSLATTIAPYLGATFIFIAAGANGAAAISQAQLAHSVRMPYVYLAVFTFALALCTAFVRLPEVIELPSSNENLSPQPEVRSTIAERPLSAWSFPHLRLGAIAIFTYVGAEVAIGSVLIAFLAQPSMGSMPHLVAARYVSLYWGGAMVGRFIGFVALRFVDTARALAAVAASAMLLVTVTVFGHGHVALWTIVACGLFNSVMWPCIFPLSVKGLGRFTNQGSGILVAMIVGGAIVPELQGLLADAFGYQPSFVIVLACYAYLLYFALSGHRIREPAR